MHNVDEVWAYFDAEGRGRRRDGRQRAKDFGLGEHELGNDVVAAVVAARDAVAAKDPAALDAAAEIARGAMNRVFALAVKKYAVEAGKDDAKARSEGLAFSWGLIGELSAADQKTIEAAFAEDAGGGRGEDRRGHPRRRSRQARDRRAAAGVSGGLNRSPK